MAGARTNWVAARFTSSTSLKLAIAASPGTARDAEIPLGGMQLIGSSLIDRLIDACDAALPATPYSRRSGCSKETRARETSFLRRGKIFLN